MCMRKLLSQHATYHSAYIDVVGLYRRTGHIVVRGGPSAILLSVMRTIHTTATTRQAQIIDC